MDVILSPKSQTLTLISSSSSSSFSRRISSLQKEFLGYGAHNRLRPPPGLLLRSRRKCKKKLGFQVHQSYRFNFFKATLDSQPVLVIVTVAAAAAAVATALTVIYLNYTRRKNGGFNQLSGLKDADNFNSLEVTKQGRALRQQGTESQIADSTELNADIPVIKIRSETEKSSVNGHLTVGKEVRYEKSASLNREVVTAQASNSDSLSIHASSASGAVSIKEPEGMGMPLPPHLCSTLGGVESASFRTGIPELISSGLADAELGSKFLHALEETNESHKPDNEVVGSGDLQINGYNSFFNKSVREELHTFYEENQSGVTSVTNFGNLKSVSPSSLPHSKNLPSLRPNVLNGAEVTAHGFHHTSVFLNGKVPIASYKNDSPAKRKDFNKVEEDMENSQRDWPRFPKLDGEHANIEHDISKNFSTYNRLLREGRLSDCVDLLELMEQRGLLDTDKIYHARFFNTCKSQKAVNEAFRFIRLIGNPTQSTFNMLLSVCASSQDSEGAFQVLQLVKGAGLKADCKLYTTLISTCAKSGKVDAMFEVFHEMVNAGIEPNLHTYGALIDGCARAGQVAKAFGAYGILRSKKVKPDRVVFNALITACGQSGAVDRAFDVLAEMRSEATPVDPDHVTVGALIKTCVQAGQFDRVHEVYKMIHQYNIKGTPEVYTIAVNSCSQMGDLEFALSIYGDMTRNGVAPDEMFLSALIDVAGHAGKIDVSFDILQEARTRRARLGNVAYSSLMGACSNAKNWRKALELYKDIKSIKLHPTVSTLNALVTALCDGDRLHKAVEVLTEMKGLGVHPNIITYTILFIASDKKNEIEVGSMLYSQAKKDGLVPNLVMCRCLIGMCLRRFEKAYSLGEHVISFNSGKPQIDNKWTSLALAVYRESVVAGVSPTIELFSLVLGCLQFPRDISLRNRLVENLGVSTDASRRSNLCSLIDGFGEYDPRSFSLLEEAASLGIVPRVSFKRSPIIADARKLQIHTAEVYLLTILKGLKHRLAAGAKLPNINIILPVDKTQVLTPKGEKTIKLAGRVGQAVAALLRRLRLPYQGNESYGKIRINGLSVKRWFQPKLASPFSGKPAELNVSQMRLARGISDQQRHIRTSNLSLESEDK